MRICLYTDTALPKLGGQELVVDALARQFQAAGHQVTVLAPQPRRPLRPDDAQVPYTVARHPRFFSSRLFVGWYRRWLLRLHRSQPFDVLHCHGVYPPGYLAALCRADLGVPTLITSHGGDVESGNVRLSKAGLRSRYVRAVEAADALIAISRSTFEGLTRLCPQTHKIVHIPNGVDLTALTAPVARPAGFAPAIRPGEYALFLGRLKRRKGVDLLLDALALLPASGIRLVVVGSGEERDALEAQAVRLGLRERVLFVGPAFGVAKAYLLQNAVCTVMPSRHAEAFPLVVLESYGAGVPVIGTRIPGLAELVQHDRTGLLVEPDAPASLALALRYCFEQRHACTRMGVEARAVAEKHAWPVVAREHLVLYEQLHTVRAGACVRSWRMRLSPAARRFETEEAEPARELSAVTDVPASVLERPACGDPLMP